MSKSAREIALNILNEVTKEGAYSNISVNRNIDKSMKDVDASLVREIVYGVLEQRIYIDYVIEKFSKVRLKKISPLVMNILRIGIYQLLFMDRIPESAAVNESVKLAKKHTHKGSQGFVNGLLRSVSRDKEKIELPLREKEETRYLSVKYSHPEWMVRKWIDEFGPDFTENLLDANNRRPKLNIRTNALKISRDELLEKLRKKGLVCSETEFARDGIVITNPVNITETDEFREGLFQIQDESSMLVAQIMDPKEDSLVIDVCSAPGGKTTHIAEKMKNRGKIIARDIYPHKLKLIEENSLRLGIDIIETQKWHALVLDESLIKKADYCLVDAPCSGMGLIRRKPDIKWTKTDYDLKQIESLQEEILKISSNYVKSGGILVYSTCTIEKNENINLIEKFLKENQEFSLVDFSELVDNSEKLLTHTGYLELFPNVHDTDGFFIAKMKRR